MSFANGGLSGVEMAVLLVLVALCLAVGVTIVRQMRGKTQSDVSGLKLKNRSATPPQP